MTVVLEATIEGQTELQRYLLGVETAIKDWKPALEASAKELMKSFQLNFDARGGLFGGWAARKKSYPWPLLEKTGAMRGSFYQQITPDKLVIGNRAPYFPYHQSNAPRTRLPRRVMMAIDETRAVLIVKAFQAQVQAAIKAGL